MKKQEIENMEKMVPVFNYMFAHFASRDYLEMIERRFNLRHTDVVQTVCYIYEGDKHTNEEHIQNIQDLETLQYFLQLHSNCLQQQYLAMSELVQDYKRHFNLTE